MTIQTRRFLAVALAVTLGVVIAITDIHRLALAAVWPLVTDFWAYYIAF